MATDSVGVCEVVRIAHIMQGHYPCCNPWLLFVHVSHRGVDIYSVVGQAFKRLLLGRQQLRYGQSVKLARTGSRDKQERIPTGFIDPYLLCQDKASP